MNASIFSLHFPSPRKSKIGALLMFTLFTTACGTESQSGPFPSGLQDADSSKQDKEANDGPASSTSAQTPAASGSAKEEQATKDPQDPEKPDEPVNENPEWDYEEGGDMGPELWGDLSPAYATCKTGQAQSPIDITKATRDKNLPTIDLSYSPAPYQATDNGHTIVVTVPAGNFITVGSKRYELEQYHFHSGSEHLLQGKRHAMEIQFVHKTKSGDRGIFAVLVKAGNRNRTLSAILDNLPDPGSTITKPKLSVDPAGIFPLSLQHFEYDGSLTTPPCTEGIRWHVLRTPITASQAQIDAFGKLYGPSHRPAQALNKREVLTKYHF